MKFAVDLLCAALLIAGAIFVLLAAIGLLRLPDLFLRMSATSKAVSLGIGLILLAVVFKAEDPGLKGRALAAIAFLFLTAPVAAHRIGRAAFTRGVPLWKGTVCNELADAMGKREEVEESGAWEGREAGVPERAP